MSPQRTMVATRVDVTIHHHDPANPKTKAVWHAAFGVDEKVDRSELSVSIDSHYDDDTEPGDMYRKLVPNKLHDVTLIGKNIRFEDPVVTETGIATDALAMEVRCLGDYGMALVCPRCERLTEVRAQGHRDFPQATWPTLSEIITAALIHRKDHHDA